MGGFFDEIRAYVGWTEKDGRALARLESALPRVLDELVEDFYSVILSQEVTRAILADDAQLQRLKNSLRDWAKSLVAGPHDERWFEARSRIGHRHVEVGLPIRFMPLAMDRLRTILTRLAVSVDGKEPARLERTLVALNKALDLELTIMLESYHEMQHGRVRQAERLGTLGRLAASVSHELKNPLGVINTSLLLLERQLARPAAERDPKVIETHLKRIGRGSKQAARMSSQLLEYARSKRPNVRAVMLGPLLEDTIAMIDDRGAVKIEARAEPDDATAALDPADISQVLANLVRNALQAIQESGAGSRITVRARRDELGVSFVVTDDGPGISAENVGRIFEPLFTTRATGTGLGLPIAKDLVEAHGGKLTVASTPGRGAAFTVMLPQESGASTDHGAPARSARRGTSSGSGGEAGR